MNDASSVSGNKTLTRGIGGGIFNIGDVVLRDSSSVLGNSAHGYRGGGIFNLGVVGLFGSSSVSGNRAGQGGGIYNDSNVDEQGTVSLHGWSSVSGNRVSSFGGGIYNLGTLGLRGRSSVSRNTVIDDFSEGGGAGIYNLFGGTATLNDSSSVWGNEVGQGAETLGGGGILNHGILTLRNLSSVKGNTTGTNGPGGGIANGGTLTMKGASSVRRNVANNAHGGGIYNDSGTVTMNGASSVRRNVAVNDIGGGIFNDSGSLIGAVAGGNVSDNVPDDIAP
jgi:hypothetical protein